MTRIFCARGKVRMVRWIVECLLAGCVAALVALPVGVTAGAETSDTSDKTRLEAAKAIPFARMNEETQRKILSVVENPSLFRRMPTKTVDCDPDLFLFLVRNPEVVINVWQMMGVTNMTAKRTGTYAWDGNDGAGTKCSVELLYGTDNLHILYGDGFYEGPLFKKKMYGRCVLVLRSEAQQGQDQRSYVGSQLDVFLVVDNAGVDLLARTLGPLVGTTADSNFEESAKFLSRLSQTAETNPAGMQRLSEKLTNCQPEVRDQLAQVSSIVNQRAAIRSTTTDVPRAAAASALPRGRQ
jgi:hypothetical protein